MKKNGNLFIISAPSGAGKTSLIQALIHEDKTIKMSVSYTTRAPRGNEKDGIDYHFVNTSQFKTMIKNDRFLEYAIVFGHYYGTSQTWVEEQLEQGLNIILEIDWQGAQQIKSIFSRITNIFILPPDYRSLYKRLVNRNDHQAVIEQRMQQAKEQISHYQEYDYVIINDDFDKALRDLQSIIDASHLSTCFQASFYQDFITQLMAEAG